MGRKTEDERRRSAIPSFVLRLSSFVNELNRNVRHAVPGATSAGQPEAQKFVVYVGREPEAAGAAGEAVRVGVAAAAQDAPPRRVWVLAPVAWGVGVGRVERRGPLPDVAGHIKASVGAGAGVAAGRRCGAWAALVGVGT